MDFFLIRVFPAILFGGIGLFMFFIANKNIRDCKAIAGWAKTQAMVESSTFEERKAQRRNARTHLRYTTTYYVPMIKYSYNVFGTPYQSTGYHNASGGGYHEFKEDEQARIIADYPPGKTVTITYNPDNPSEAYLLPETSIVRPVRNRAMAMVIIAAALLWVGWGAVINIKQSLSEKASETQLHNSPGLLPASTEQINTKLDEMLESYDLECQEETYGGYELTYHQRLCETLPGNDLASVEIFNRNEAPEKVDLISALFTQTDQKKTISFFSDVAAFPFQGDESQAVRDWVNATIPTLTKAGDSAEINIGGVRFVFDVLGGTTRLNIGKLQ